MGLILIIVIVIVSIVYANSNKDSKSFLNNDQIAYNSINRYIDLILNYQQEIACLMKNGSYSLRDGKKVPHSRYFTSELIQNRKKDVGLIFISLLGVILKYFPNYPNGSIKLSIKLPSGTYERTINIQDLLKRRFKVEDWMKNVLVEFSKSLAAELEQKSEMDDLDKQLSQVIKMAERIFQEIQEEGKK